MYRICRNLRIQSLSDFLFEAASEDGSDFDDDFDEYDEFKQVEPIPVGPNDMSLREKMTTFFESQTELGIDKGAQEEPDLSAEDEGYAFNGVASTLRQ